MEQETPVSRDRARGAGIWAVLHLLVYYGIAGLIWGFALKQSLIWFAVSGALLGLILGALLAFPVIASQKSEERVREMSFAVGAIWGNLAILVGLVGLIALVVRLVFF